jgi:predicted transcriptional regulator
MEKASSCDIRVQAYRNSKTMEQCRGEARKNTEVLSDEILKKGEVSWTRILEVANHDELVYKLTLKYLRQRGYNIGYNKDPRVRRK